MSRLIFAFVVACAFVLAYQFTPPFARLDDAYIALHSARVVLSGYDPVFGVQALVGATSPAYVALLAGLIAAGGQAISRCGSQTHSASSLLDPRCGTSAAPSGFHSRVESCSS